MVSENKASILNFQKKNKKKKHINRKDLKFCDQTLKAVIFCCGAQREDEERSPNIYEIR